MLYALALLLGIGDPVMEHCERRIISRSLGVAAVCMFIYLPCGRSPIMCIGLSIGTPACMSAFAGGTLGECGGFPTGMVPINFVSKCDDC